jgi:hypothetical protein
MWYRLRTNLDLSRYLLWSCGGTNLYLKSQGRERSASAVARKGGVAPAPDFISALTPAPGHLIEGKWVVLV